MYLKRLNIRLRKSLIALLCATIIVIGTITVKFSYYRRIATDENAKLFSLRNMSSQKDAPFYEGCVDTQQYLKDSSYERQNAAFVMLTRNQELDGVINTIQSLERRFNQWFQYPYVLLNNEPFTAEFQDVVQSLTKAQVTFAHVNETLWDFPNEDSKIFEHYVESQGDRGIMYGSMVSYHKMCRFYSGMFYKHPEVAKLEWYWRIEPDVEFFCDITYDPFFEMKKAGKSYGFTIFIKELYWTVPNLFRATKSFIRSSEVKLGSLWKLFVRNYKLVEGDDYLNSFINEKSKINTEVTREVLIEELMRKWKREGVLEEELIKEVVFRNSRKIPVVEDKFDDEEYNLCHFWSNFEIARVDVFDNPTYNEYFNYLESWGGFWQERWGDAPVHSLGLALTLNVEDVHYFRDIGYQHSTLAHCPKNKHNHQLPYVPNSNYSDIFLAQKARMRMLERMSELFRSDSTDRATENGSGCRCQCPNLKETEDTSHQCLKSWFNMVSDSRDARSDKPLNTKVLKDRAHRNYLRLRTHHPQ